MTAGPNIHIMGPTGERERRKKEIFKEILQVDFTQLKKIKWP